ncbi:hypothetical protein FF125_13045 [Aureibaculum algae]|uniref:Uncharacterized protein n=1 Tax=Aureibaculum algae TaxID=2584122 RepID=A0A5B7TSX9_9FLAO|nr:hypothetical protein [Aureibaculum algae]QCX39318.1 hypothetical protein FF125_13045 [Aureibaculum algae]
MCHGPGEGTREAELRLCRKKNAYAAIEKKLDRHAIIPERFSNKNCENEKFSEAEVNVLLKAPYRSFSKKSFIVFNIVDYIEQFKV